jgi:type 1 glutamine amidotransferase
MKLLLAAFIIGLIGLPVLRAQTQTTDRPRLRALVINGQNNHDWEATSASVRQTLLSTKRFDVVVSTSPPPGSDDAAWEAWRPPFSDHQVVVVDYNGDPWPAPVRTAFEAFVKGGGGVVNVHAANNAFPEWDAWNSMIGLGWRNADFGDRLTVDPDTGKTLRTKKGEGIGAGHGHQHAFPVTVRSSDHPIMRGFPPVWLHAKDELYHGLRGPAGSLTILSSAWSDPKTSGTGAHEPITWVIPYGKGRVVTTVMGHHWRGQKDFDALHCVGFQAVIARACEWAALGEVTLPVPRGFPTEKETSVVPPGDVSW